VGVALVLGLVSASRILGNPWFYLVLWAWTIALLAIVAIVWTAVIVVRDRGRAGPSAARAAVAALAVVLAGWTVVSAVDAVDAEPTDARESAMLAQLTDAVAAAIESGDVPGGGPDGRYLLTWTDGIHIGAPGYGMLDELERRGYDVGVLQAYAASAVEHRSMEIGDATAEIHISLGPDIPVWDGMPGARQLVHIDPRTDAERRAYDDARADALAAIQAAGRDDLVDLLDTAPFMLYFDDRLPAAAKAPIAQMNDLGQPAAVYVGPVSLAP
jgi:hypothetical protein